MTKVVGPYIPYDIYESPQEIVIIMPLGGVDKNSIEISLKNYRLIIIGKRSKPLVKDNFVCLKSECYRGDIQKTIDLPSQVYFEKIHSKLRLDNILEIIVPKIIVPEKISLEIEYDD